MALCFSLCFYLHYSNMNFFVCFVRALLLLQTSLKADLFLAASSSFYRIVTETHRLVWTQSELEEIPGKSCLKSAAVLPDSGGDGSHGELKGWSMWRLSYRSPPPEGDHEASGQKTSSGLSRAVGPLGRVSWQGFSSVKLLEFVVKEMNSSCRQLRFHPNEHFHRCQQEAIV